MIGRINERYDSRIQNLYMVEGFEMANRPGMKKRLEEKRQRKIAQEKERLLRLSSYVAATVAVIDAILIISIMVMGL